MRLKSVLSRQALCLQDLVQVQIRSQTDQLVSVKKPLSYSCIRDYFKSSLTRLVPDISLLRTHSLRAGNASAAANAGDPDRLFQRHRRWKCVFGEDGYVDGSLISRFSVSKKLGIKFCNVYF